MCIIRVWQADGGGIARSGASVKLPPAQPVVADIVGADWRRCPTASAWHVCWGMPSAYGMLGACQREGSLDANIRKPAANDFARLRELCPMLETVGFNGQTSGKFSSQFAAAEYRAVILPSTSLAHASLGFEQKLRAWHALAEDKAEFK
jgi:hypothetical protein